MYVAPAVERRLTHAHDAWSNPTSLMLWCATNYAALSEVYLLHGVVSYPETTAHARTVILYLFIINTHLLSYTA